jgi:Inner membrane protein YgaP-like, transmembrane domain
MKNVGSTDKIIRIVLGVAIGAWGIWAQNWWGLIGLVPLGTALMGWCPAYFPFKINTAKK